MNNKVLKTLEYNKITEKLETFASSDGGKKTCTNLVPQTNIELIKKELIKGMDSDEKVLRMLYKFYLSVK